jgi:hypothetical protein
MRKFKTALVILAALILINACRSADKLYSKGNYEAAFYKALKNSNSQTNYNKNAATIESSFNYAVTDYLQEIDKINSSREIYKAEAKARYYKKISNMENALAKHRYASVGFTSRNHYALYEQAIDEAIQFRVDRAKSLMASQSIKDRKEAYYEAKQAKNLSINYNSSLEQLCTDTYENAVIRIAVIVNDANSIFNTGWGNSNYNTSQEIINTLNQSNNDEFIEFIHENNNWGNQKNYAKTLNIQLGYRNTDRVYTQQRETNETARVVIRETVYRPDSIVREYGNVHARFITTTYSLQAEGALTYQLKDANDWRTNYQQNLTERYNWEDEAYSFTGDRRALNNNQTQKINSRNQINTPNNEEVVNALKNKLINQLNQQIENQLRWQ